MEDSEIQIAVERHLYKITKESKVRDREEALANLRRDLMDAGNKKKKYPLQKTRKVIAQQLIEVYKKTGDQDFSTPIARRRILQMVTTFGDDVFAKPFVLLKLEKGTEDERAEILAVLGMPGAIGGDDAYDKVVELVGKGIVKRDAQPALLARLNKNRALPVIIKDVETSQDRRAFLYAAWALQSYFRRPEDYKKILPRIKELELDKKFDAGGNGLFWLDATLLSKYLNGSQGGDLKVVLEIMVGDSSVMSPACIPILITKLQDDDVENRSLAANALEKASDFGHPEVILNALNTALAKEPNESAKAAIRASITNIERHEKAWHEMLQKQPELRK